jgi:hypothetical protein
VPLPVLRSVAQRLREAAVRPPPAALRPVAPSPARSGSSTSPPAVRAPDRPPGRTVSEGSGDCGFDAASGTANTHRGLTPYDHPREACPMTAIDR